jgi:hypothetical protein
VDLFHGFFERHVPDAETRLVYGLGFMVLISWLRVQGSEFEALSSGHKG